MLGFLEGEPGHKFDPGGAIQRAVRTLVLAVFMAGALEVPVEAALASGDAVEFWQV
jgi:hypothetical protein